MFSVVAGVGGWVGGHAAFNAREVAVVARASWAALLRFNTWRLWYAMMGYAWMGVEGSHFS